MESPLLTFWYLIEGMAFDSLIVKHQDSTVEVFPGKISSNFYGDNSSHFRVSTESCGTLHWIHYSLLEPVVGLWSFGTSILSS